eukprot:COSAG02_NODE_6439_length_3568_cov_2.991352_2_plen_305_part_01
MSSESRGPVERAVQSGFKSLLEGVGKRFTGADVRKLCISSMEAGTLRHEDTSLACGWALLTGPLQYATAVHDDAGFFSSALALYRRVEPSLLPESWWSETSCCVDVTSARLACLWGGFGMAKRLPSAPQSATESPWWSELLDHAIRLVKVNASAGLSGRDTMSFNALLQASGVVELAAQDESQHEMLLACGVADALEYGILHDFTFVGSSIATYAGGACLALVGKNEGGKTLHRDAVHTVLDRVHAYFRPETLFASLPVKSLLPHFNRVITMSVSDANKKLMLQFTPLIDMLLECLVINDDNQRK